MFLFFLSTAVCLARLDPEWKLGTVAGSSLLRHTSALEIPVYAPSGTPIADVPGIQLMAIQSSQLVIVGEKTAYIVDKPGAAARPPKTSFSERLHFNTHVDCVLTSSRQVLYYPEKNALTVLDDNGQVCRLAIAGQAALHPEPPAKSN